MGVRGRYEWFYFQIRPMVDHGRRHGCDMGDESSSPPMSFS